MKTNRGYDDTKNLLMMATGLADGTYSSVHQAARAILDETGGPNVDRLRRKFRELQRAGGFDAVGGHDSNFDPSEDWKLRISDFPIFVRTTAQNVWAFVRNPSNLFRKAMKSPTPVPLAFMLMAMILVLAPTSALLYEFVIRGTTEAFAGSLTGLVLGAICINASTVVAEQEAALLLDD